MPMGGHSPLPLLPQEGRPWGSSPPRPPNASRLLLLSLGAWPLPPAYSIASYTRAASKAGTGGGERGGEGREWGGRVKEGEEDRKTSRSWHDVTSGLFGRGGTRTSLTPPPEESQVGAGPRAGGGARWTRLGQFI